VAKKGLFGGTKGKDPHSGEVKVPDCTSQGAGSCGGDRPAQGGEGAILRISLEVLTKKQSKPPQAGPTQSSLIGQNSKCMTLPKIAGGPAKKSSGQFEGRLEQINVQKRAWRDKLGRKKPNGGEGNNLSV